MGKGPTPASVSETCTGCSPRIDDHVLAGGKPITFSLDTGFQTHNVNYAPNAGSSCCSSSFTSGVPCSECRSMPSAYGKGFYVPLDDAGSSIVLRIALCVCVFCVRVLSAFCEKGQT